MGGAAVPFNPLSESVDSGPLWNGLNGQGSLSSLSYRFVLFELLVLFVSLAVAGADRLSTD